MRTSFTAGIFSLGMLALMPWIVLFVNAITYIVGDDPFLTYARGVAAVGLGLIMIPIFLFFLTEYMWEFTDGGNS